MGEWEQGSEVVVVVEADPGRAVDVPRRWAGDDIPPLEYLIDMWIAAKTKPSGPNRTAPEYRIVLTSYRTMLQAVRLDLDCGDHHKLTEVALIWAKLPRTRDGKPVSDATVARRIAIVSSFYLFAMKHRMHEWQRDRTSGELQLVELVANPMRLMERPTVQAYAAALPLDLHDVDRRLAAIDRTTAVGKRDYALLTLAMVTGKRLAEIQAMQWRHLKINNQGIVTVRWRAKGGKTLYDALPRPVGDALLDWVVTAYAAEAERGEKPAPEAPIWLSLARTAAFRARVNQEHGQKYTPLSRWGVGYIFEQRLGITKVHTSRHTFALAMEQAGAKLTDIQARLGHSSSATTARYMNAIKAPQNPYADRVAALFGLK